MSAAKWHREQAANEHRHAEAVRARVKVSAAMFANGVRAEAAESAARGDHHATAADALEALAVPGVRSLFEHLAISLSMQTDADGRVGTKWMLSDEERAALATLAKIGGT